MTRLRRGTGAPVALGRELGRGGEGAVFPVTAAPDLVAKIYLKPPAANKIEKLRSMARRASPALLKVAAWPVDVLTDETGAVRGFLMPKVSAREDVHQLYSPKSRRRAFPGADFRFVVRAAANVARAFAQMHSLGHVVGDVNHGNALVGRDGTVVLIDCDSFQIRDGARQFTCDVGVPLFTAPELAGQVFRGLRRTPNHDAFGLAVLVFHLLYLGRHPYAGRHVDGEMPIERAIAESRFAYGVNAEKMGMSRPPGTLSLEAFGPRIAQLFELAFAPPSETARPTASSWVDALQALESELVDCTISPAHWYRRGDPGGGPGHCCWCSLERDTGMRLFTRELANVAAAGAVQLARLWDAIQEIEKPGKVKPLDDPGPATMQTMSDDPLGAVPTRFAVGLLAWTGISAVQHGGPHSTAIAIGTFTLACAFLAWRWWRKASLELEAEPALAVARRQFALAVKRWNALCRDDRFERRLLELSDLKRRLLELPAEREERLKQLRMDAQHLQRDEFLDGFRIDQALLRSVSSQDLAHLASWGIETAEDFLRLSENARYRVPDQVLKDIERWALARSREFRFDPHRVAETTVVQHYERQLHEQQSALLATLAQGEKDLKELAESIAAQRSETQAEIDAANRAIAAARSERA